MIAEAPIVPVSVVIPCFRCASTVRRAVDSVAGQSHAPAQIILVDDGSGDDTLESLQSIKRSLGGNRVSVVALPDNRGAASARNAGWSIASGEYVAFLDADDAWHPRKIEIQYAFMRARPDLGLSGHRHAQIEDGALDHAGAEDPGYQMISFGKLLLSNRFITPSVMVRREIAHRFLEGRRYMEDHLLWMEIASAGVGVARLNGTLAFIYKRPFGASGLSAQLLEMEKAELANYRTLEKRGAIGSAPALMLQGYSLAKFARRVLVSGFRS